MLPGHAALGKSLKVAFKTSTIVFNIINKMSVNYQLFIYQLTANFLANCQLTTNLISTLNPAS